MSANFRFWTLALAAVALASSVVRSRGEDSTPTYARDVAPILFSRCATCHRPGGSGPFSVLTYVSTRTRATQIAQLTRSRAMPPWKADDVPGGLVGQPRLSQVEIDTIDKWVRGGAPEGDEGSLPPVPTFPEGWQLGTPDLIVQPPAYTLRADGTDDWRIFAVALPVDAVRYVRGLEFHPGNARVVHHANIRVDRTPTSRQLDEADPAPGYDGLLAHTAVYPDGHFLAWTPGQVAPLLPKGLAWRLNPGTDLVIELHMQPSGREEIVQPTVGLFFGADPPERTPAMIRLGKQDIEIPAGESHYVETDTFVLPVDVEVQAVQPHAHYRARDILGEARLPDGSIRQLIHIGDWDFRWQHLFRYAQPFALPRGTTLSMRYVFDNSAANPRNPDRPPRRVEWGQRSGDEMGDLWIQVLARDDRDLQALNDALRPKILSEDIQGHERLIRADPASAPLHDDLALMYLDAGRYDLAVSHFRSSLALKPQSAPAHFNLGVALTLAGDRVGAIVEYERSIELAPSYPIAQNNLGVVLLQQGDATAAATHFEEAARLDSTYAEAFDNLGRALGLLGRWGDAVAAFRRAVDLRPDWAAALDNLGLALAESGDGAGAADAERRAIAAGLPEPAAARARERIERYRPANR
jgi:Flp pilus assembly protein TadD/mono/diheme cytochrome c family protein